MEVLPGPKSTVDAASWPRYSVLSTNPIFKLLPYWCTFELVLHLKVDGLQGRILEELLNLLSMSVVSRVSSQCFSEIF